MQLLAGWNVKFWGLNGTNISCIKEISKNLYILSKFHQINLKKIALLKIPLEVKNPKVLSASSQFSV
jgi:hypothetical protein